MKKITKCIQYSSICHFSCCNHTDNSPFSLWMYPGEYENASLEKNHIIVTGFQNGAVLGKCKCTSEQRRMCDGTAWFKPLDCWSYPFFPAISEGKLVLRIDVTRCPLANSCDLSEYYSQVYRAWQSVIRDKNVFRCIEQTNLIYFESCFSVIGKP